MTFIQALLRNLGNLCCHVKGNAQQEHPGGRIPKGGTGGGLTRSSAEAPVMGVVRKDSGLASESEGVS